MADIKYINGDAISVAKIISTRTPVCIPHVCNDEGKWGAGFVIALSNEWPAGSDESPEDAYHNTQPLLGTVSYSNPVDGICVANMVAQHGTGGWVRRIHYGMLAHCMEIVNNRFTDKSHFICPQFGAGLGGGDWEVIEELIEGIWCKTREVIVVKFKEASGK
jgi:hypothetical protein